MVNRAVSGYRFVPKKEALLRIISDLLLSLGGDGSAKRRVRLSKYMALSMKTNDLSQIKLEKRDFFREQSHYVP